MNKNDDQNSRPEQPTEHHEWPSGVISGGDSSYAANAAHLFNQTEGEELAQRYDIRKLYLGIQRHLFIITFLTLLSVGLGSYATWYNLTHYRAEAVVLFQEDLPKTLPGGITLNNLSVATALDLITLQSHFQAVKSVLGLDLSVKELEKMVEVPLPRNNSYLIRIICKSDNPNLSIEIANTLARIAVKSSREFNQKQLQEELENFKKQLADSSLEMTTELKEIEEFKKSHQYFEMTADYASTVNQITDARSKVQSANLRYNSLLVEYQNLKREAENMPAEVEMGTSTASPRLDPTQARISTLQANLAEAKAKYAPGNPKIKILQDELNDLLKGKSSGEGEPGELLYERNLNKERLTLELMRMESKVRSAQKVKQELSDALVVLEKELETLPADQMAFSKLLKAKQTTEERVTFLTKAVESIQLMLNVPKGGLELYQLAEKAKPLRDSWWIQILPLLGLLFGLPLGIFAALLLEMRDPHFYTVKQLDLAYALPTLAVIPQIPSLSSKNSVQKSLFFIRSLAERIEKLPKASEVSPLAITFTSSSPKEGKSFLAYNLAYYYSCIGKKVALLEMDPHTGPYSNEEAPAPLENYLRGNIGIEEIIKPGKPDRIRIGSAQPFMKELLKTQKMALLMQHLKKSHDLIIIDAPGVIEEEHSTNAAELADLCLFVIGAPVAPRNHIDESLRTLAHVGVIPAGFVLNRVPLLFIDDQRIKIETKRYKPRFWI